MFCGVLWRARYLEMPNFYDFHATSIAEVHSEIHGLANTCGVTEPLVLSLPKPYTIQLMLSEASIHPSHRSAAAAAVFAAEEDQEEPDAVRI